MSFSPTMKLAPLASNGPRVGRNGYRSHPRAGQRIVGTCQWVLARPEYHSWINGDDLQLLWLTGAPGIGKTVLVFFLVKELQQIVQESPSTTLARYFCDYKDEKKRTTTSIQRSIVVQLLRQQPQLFDKLKDDYKTQRGSVAGNLDALWKMLVRSLQNLDDPVYILVDALNECEEPSRRDLLSLLADLEPTTKARILITGMVVSGMDESDHDTGIHLRIEPSMVTGDVASFIDLKIDELMKKNLFRGSVEDIKRITREKAGGTFL
ncbi:hypothetical protein ACJZ2D_002515 [Fusarium nematophilum]